MQIKTTINDIEPRIDKNNNPYYKLTLTGYSNCFYAFSYELKTETLSTLKATPYQLVNQLALISYEEKANKNNSGTFLIVKGIQLL